MNKKKDKIISSYSIALIGNPNVGKSTVFNALTGMHQHTGNWCGKTVECAVGTHIRGRKEYNFVDLPGCYSLSCRSPEEEISRNYILNSHPDAVVAVCDATCLERNLNLVLQICAVTPHVLLCVNLMDEAAKKHIRIDFNSLEKHLKIPVIGITARNPKSTGQILSGIEKALDNTKAITPVPDSCWAEDFTPVSTDHSSQTTVFLPEKCCTCRACDNSCSACGTYISHAAYICQKAVTIEDPGYAGRDRRLDALFTSKRTGFPIMFFFLLGIFWLTIVGANVPSDLLNKGLFWLEPRFYSALQFIGLPAVLCKVLVYGIYRVVAWVVSVMLPPMAIFFPLFTLLEDYGYLPRIAFNLDYCFQKCCACGKQALCMCMGFGCNAAGVTGCRIIDSPRERLIAILTNSFVPCNGRFPTILAVLTMFFAVGTGIFSSLSLALMLTAVILLGILMTFFSSWLLSKTVLKGVPSSFTLELPPYRRPQFIRVLVRSVLDRTLHVLWRALIAAAPAGLIIWILANVSVGDTTLLLHLADFLEPAGQLMGLDGTILLAFLLGLPANEIVVPIMIMAYTAQNTLTDLGSLTSLHSLLIQNGWTCFTAVSMLLFTLMHWPCATTLLTIKKETHSLKWTFLAFLLPTVMGFLFCVLFNFVVRLFF